MANPFPLHVQRAGLGTQDAGARKAILVHLHLKAEWCMRLKQLCNCKFGDSAVVIGIRKVSTAFKKRDPGPLQDGLRV